MKAVGAGVTVLKPGDRVAYVGTLGAYATERNIAASAWSSCRPRSASKPLRP